MQKSEKNLTCMYVYICICVCVCTCMCNIHMCVCISKSFGLVRGKNKMTLTTLFSWNITTIVTIENGAKTALLHSKYCFVDKSIYCLSRKLKVVHSSSSSAFSPFSFFLFFSFFFQRRIFLICILEVITSIHAKNPPFNSRKH